MSKGGPATEEGKEVARWNATRHGMRSPAPVVPGVETRETWERHLSGILESLAPEGHLETVLAERVALLSWRLHRATRYETESIALYQEKAEDDLARERRFESHVLGPAHPENVRDELESARETHRLLKRLPKMPDGRRLSAFDADLILWKVTEHADRVADGEEAPEDLLERTSIPGVPDGAQAREDFEGWTAGAVRAGIEAVAEAAGEDARELLEFATAEAKRAIIGKEQAAERVARDLERMSRERLLPRVEVLEKVARYEAHLSRLFHKALHELEAMQVRRSGGAAPLARLDVEGLPEGLGSES
ncbi:MAG: hypothetical protein M3R38_15185 [Actinomycetota bacterium]|nr:hypothetical protein [Actinomycetota bacterium]